MAMRSIHCRTTDELFDSLWLPKRVGTVEEELLILAELSLRQLNARQILFLHGKFSAERRQYDYRACSLLNNDVCQQIESLFN